MGSDNGKDFFYGVSELFENDLVTIKAKYRKQFEAFIKKAA